MIRLLFELLLTDNAQKNEKKKGLETIHEMEEREGLGINLDNGRWFWRRERGVKEGLGINLEN